MKYKPGDIVIKKTGGNKMTINNHIGGYYRCFWFVDSQLLEDVFSEDDIVTLDEYKSFLKMEKIDDTINQLLK